MTSRRHFLAGLAALALPCPTWADVGSPAFLAAAKAGDDYRLIGLAATGEAVFSLPLPARGHAATAHPQRPLAVAFARRPGTYALVIDCARGEVAARLTPPEGRQFNGHGAFSADGALLYTSEVVAEGSAGRIGLWDSRDFRRIGEWDSGGIGPHDIRLWDQGLIVANGGIETDPSDRTKLNLDRMQPNLARLDHAGRLAEVVELPGEYRQNSIRHLAIGADLIAFAMQWEGDPAEAVPLLGLWRPGSAPVLCHAPEVEAPRMKGYAGSIALSGGEIALTSSKGGVAMLFSAGKGDTGAFLATHARADASGVAALAGGGFVLSDGGGGLSRLTRDGLSPLRREDRLAWDNHLIALR